MEHDNNDGRFSGISGPWKWKMARIFRIRVMLVSKREDFIRGRKEQLDILREMITAYNAAAGSLGNGAWKEPRGNGFESRPRGGSEEGGFLDRIKYL
jgi:hypothetical protein